ncbi:MAG: helix-turn-helix transcriptional regulator [Provencibacterium sp.]|jgi:two-component system response regulator YesN|nr:helix-turn-helix transcriptional regulator [Provencibacterium sp.]
MLVDLSEFMTEILRYRGVQVLLLNGDPDKAAQMDYGFRLRMADGFDYAEAANKLERSLEEGVQYFLEDDLKLSYTLFRFPKRPQQQEPYRILSIGPVLFRTMEEESLSTLIKAKKIDPRYTRDFLEFYNRIPLVLDKDAWNRSIHFCLEKLTGGPIPYREHVSGFPELFSARYADDAMSALPDVALSTLEERYRWEDEMLSAVAAGNLSHALEAHYRFIQYKLLPRTADPVRDRKNLLITFNTLLRKAAQAGQVHPLHIDNLSRQLAVQIESALTIDQLDGLAPHMLRKYCMLVNNYSRQSNSQLVRGCMDYIDFHYNEELSLATLARKNSVSASYLSGLFKKENGMTLTDYINATRIRRALLLLNTSGLSIGVIAARCGFPDANYFTRTFKKYQGITPTAYRESVWEFTE